MASSPCRVFISYTTRQREDRTLATKLRDMLPRSIHAFLGDRDMKEGGVWSEQIEKEIRTCTHFVVFITAAAEHRKAVLEEIEHARRYQPTIIPVLVGDVEKNLLPDVQAIKIGGLIESLDDDAAFICRRIAKIAGFRPPPAAMRRYRGPNIHQLCDREAESKTIETLLYAHRANDRGRPATLFVYADEEDEPDHFIRRAIEEWGVYDVIAEVAWLSGYEASYQLNGVKGRILRSLGLPDDDVSDGNFIKHFATADRAGFVIKHELKCTAWHRRETPKAIVEYLSLWSSLAEQPRQPAMVLVFKVVYDDLVPSDEVRKQLEDIVRRWRQMRPPMSSLMAALEEVDRGQVDDWFDDYAPDVSAKKREKFLDELFKRRKKLRMSAVESKLRQFTQTGDTR